jgi:hypothetical protein
VNGERKTKEKNVIAPLLHEVERGLGWSLSWVEVREAREKYEKMSLHTSF